MAKTYVGIDIGSCQLKLAVCSGAQIRRLFVEPMPENLVREGRIVSTESMGEFIKKAAAKARVGTRACAMILPAPQVFTRTMNMPLMTKGELALNLPYEFRDFITQEKDKYFYDYAVMDTVKNAAGEIEELELIAAATLKETINEYSEMCHKAGFRLLMAIPEELAYMNIIRNYEASRSTNGAFEYCFIDLGHATTRLHIFRGIKHQATRVIEFGAQMLDAAIAEKLNIDEHIARLRKQTDGAEDLAGEACMNIYSMVSVEVMRALNFYRFNSPDSNLTDVFLCGGGARIEPFVNEIASDIGLPIHRIDDLLPDSGGSDDAVVCPLAVGATMQ